MPRDTMITMAALSVPMVVLIISGWWIGRRRPGIGA